MTMATIGRRAALGAALATATLARPAIGQGRFPNRPVRFLIPWAPGGVLDGFMRLQAELFQQETGQPLVIENRPGARGTLAAQFLVSQARPDGYTIAHHHLSVIRHPFLTKRPTWHPVDDFTYIMQQSGFVFGHVVHPASGWNTLADMWAEARRRPGQLTYGTSGIATSNHLAMEELCEKEGVRMTHVPFRGTSENITALLARQIDCIANSNAWAPNVEAGQMRLLAVWTRERLRAFPEAPTLLELGYGMVVTSPYGIAGPKGMDPEIVERLHQLFRKTQAHPRVQEFMARNDMPDEYLGPADYTRFARERAEYEQRMVTRLGLSID
ncbi:tripartite tricarboxylate transporter substrate binding protein [Caldovatus aquaticus]|uniref:Tripartite tricarboxylate transporter substrate binding protein n=1 Tax=Caldovatus aquaticus TaxID=2865671 RepID=A0ABS7F6Z5_9PROT|nr:tripartite tricarboxylate transporter substrate binding protein [Caldovatus aquaticus]MBW8271381.1 tripartite tricarboxylate transporter substrate binding protein [Caldovatus aquaticus]